MRPISRLRFVLLGCLCPVIPLAGQEVVPACTRPLATVVVAEPSSGMLGSLGQYGLGSPGSLIRVLVQQSGCFVAVERGAGMRQMMQERDLARAGELQAGSNMGGGQMRSADLILTPSVNFSENDAGGLAGLVGSRLGGKNSNVIGAVAGRLRFKKAQTSMLLVDARSGIQVAAATGSSTRADVGLGAIGIAGDTPGGLGGYANSPEGRIVAASFAENFASIVRSVQADPRFRSADASADATSLGSPGPAVSGPVFAAGEVLRPKIDNVRVLNTPSEDAPTAATLARSDQVVFLGEERGGFIRVQASRAEGWVRKILMQK